MFKLNHKDNGYTKEIYIPDTIILPIIFGVFCGLAGVIIGLVVGICKDCWYLFAEKDWFKNDRGFW